jgi:hypothetical protein
VGLRVDQEAELIGLDLSKHGENGYRARSVDTSSLATLAGASNISIYFGHDGPFHESHPIARAVDSTFTASEIT